MSRKLFDLERPKKEKKLPVWLQPLLWVAAMACVFFMGVVIVQRTPYIRGMNKENSAESGSSLVVDSVESNPELPDLVELIPTIQPSAVNRSAELTTDQMGTVRRTSETYTISAGDSVYGIATKFDLEPETILWSNYDVLQDDAHNISVGDELIIPPGDGIYYKWKESDQLQKLANQYRVDVKSVLEYPTNNLDITNPVIKTGDYILFPGGYRDTVAFNPVVFEFSSNSGVNKKISGPGGCEWDYRSYGNGSFIWPTQIHTLTGNDFWSGHMGVDIGTAMGGAIYAADGGTVIYAGAITGGYGIMVMIDHGTGYQTLYAHLSSVAVSCGQGVSQGQVIGYGGSTGNSTGAHLHFEVRYGGGYVNPWQVL